MRSRHDVGSNSMAMLETVPLALPSGGATTDWKIALVGSIKLAMPLAGFALQVALLATIIRQFRVENAAFFQVTVLAFSGFVIHALLPLRHRCAFFLPLSPAAAWLLFGVAPCRAPRG